MKGERSQIMKKITKIKNYKIKWQSNFQHISDLNKHEWLNSFIKSPRLSLRVKKKKKDKMQNIVIYRGYT